MIIAPNATDVTLYFKLIDPAAGTPETGLTITDLDLSYVRDRGLAVKADLTALGAVNGAHEDNKAIQVDAANTPGLYRVDVPDAAFASGVGRVQVVVNGAAIDPAVLEVELAPWLTLITGAGVLVGATAEASMVDAVWDELVAGHDGAGKAGQQLWTDIDAILADTDELQTDDIPGDIAALNDVSTAQVNAEVDTALSDIRLDHLLAAAVVGADVVDDSVIAKLVSAGATADWDTFVNTTDALQAIRDRGDVAWLTGGAGALTAALIWAYATRTLTQSAAAVVAAVSGSDINITRGDTLSASLTGLGNISARTKLWLTVKRERQHTDAQSIIQVEETDGMLYLNGSLVVSLGLTAAAGSITVTDAVAGDITIAISAAAAALLQPQACYYDIQMLTAAGTVTTLTVGKVDVNADVTGAIA